MSSDGGVGPLKPKVTDVFSYLLRRRTMEKDKISSYSNVSQLIDEGLRTYMRQVFSYMSAGLAMTAIVAFVVCRSVGFLNLYYTNPLFRYAVIFAPLFIVIPLAARISKISAETARMLFFLYSATIGLSVGGIVALYSPESAAITFFVTSATFLSMVIYGYSTNKDLTSFGSFLIMGLFGLIIASLVNLFVGSSMFSLVLSCIGVLVFTGLTAYDTQRIKSFYFADAENVDEDVNGRKVIIGALELYLDFINLFLNLLRILGSRR